MVETKPLCWYCCMERGECEMSCIFTSQIEAIENIKKQLDASIEHTESELRKVHVQRNELLIFTRFRNANPDMYEPVDLRAFESELSALALKVKELTDLLETQGVSKNRFHEFVREQYPYDETLGQRDFSKCK